MEAGIEHVRMTQAAPAEAADEPGEHEPEIRIDQLTGLRTILAAGARRPPDRVRAGDARGHADASDCPFCEGNEAKTPPEVWADRPDGGEAERPGLARRGPSRTSTPRWPATAARTRPRRRPQAPPADPLRASARAGEPDLFATVPASGVHEVIDPRAPAHDLAGGPGRRGAGGRGRRLARARMRDHAESHACVQLIVNEGGGAGASLEHTHAQLYALDFVPVADRPRARALHAPTTSGRWAATCSPTSPPRRCAARERLVAIDDEAMVICPWASRSPFELRVIPREAAPRFEEDGEIGVGRPRAPPCGALRERFGEGARAQPLGPHRPPRRRASSTGTSTSRPGSRSRRASSSPPGSTSTSSRRSGPPPSCATRLARVAR